MESGSSPVEVRVLIVDDQPAFRELLEMMLAGDDRFSVVGTASNGEQALVQVRDLVPDVVVMDIAMPVMDGFEATRRIRAMDPPTPVLILTGSEDQRDRDAAVGAGATAYIAKSSLHEVADAVLAAAAA